jgi:hypothetical protein
VKLAFVAVGVALLAIGWLHLTRTERVFQFYQRMNGERRFFQFWAGWSRSWTRMVGWGAVVLGVITLAFAFA